MVRSLPGRHEANFLEDDLGYFTSCYSGSERVLEASVPRFLIEFNHSTEHEGCVRALHAIMNYGSHLITNADWGCEDGVHSGWLIADLDSRDRGDEERLGIWH